MLFGEALKDEWCLSDDIGQERRNKLLNPPSADDLIVWVEAAAQAALNDGTLSICWVPAIDSDAPFGFHRAEAQFPLDRDLFDYLFNGRSGYRAQYYVSPCDGEAFNASLVAKIKPSVLRCWQLAPGLPEVSLAELSIDGPWTKVWVSGDGNPFCDAQPNTLKPPRWVQNSSEDGMARRIPLPNKCGLDFKGTFVHPTSRGSWVDASKRTRSCDLHRRGFT